MKPKLLTITLFILCFANLIFSQEKSDGKLFEVRGIVKDQDKAVLAGLNLYFLVDEKIEKLVVSDENGMFSVKLPVGKYEITANKAVSKNFTAFIEIPADKPYPTDFELIIETNKTCCGQDENRTEVIKYTAPTYPLPATAMGAAGEVFVAVKIDKTGKVISAEAVKGHPLLRQASVEAAKLWLFSVGNDSALREGTIVFAFVPLGLSKDSTIFKKPNRLEVFKRLPEAVVVY